MKKFALAIGLVLALSCSALAATVTVGGTITFGADYYTADYTDNPQYGEDPQTTYEGGHILWSKAPEAKFTFSASGDNFAFSIGATATNKYYNDFISEADKTWQDGETIPAHYEEPVWDPVGGHWEDPVLVPEEIIPAGWDESSDTVGNTNMSVSLAVRNAYVKGSVLGLPGTFTLGQKYVGTTTSRGLWWTGTFGNLTANASYNIDPTKGYGADATVKLSDVNSVKVAYSTYMGKLASGAANDDSSLIEATVTLGKASFKGSVFSTPVTGDLSEKSGPYYAGTVSVPFGPVVVDAFAKYWSSDFSFQDGYYGLDDPAIGAVDVEAGLANDASYGKVTYNLSADGASNVSGKVWFDSDYEVSATLASVLGFKVVGTYGSYTVDETDNYDIDYGQVNSKWSVSAEKVYNNVTYKVGYDQTGKVGMSAVYSF